MPALMGSIKGTVYDFDTEAIHWQLAQIELLSRQLIEAVAEFNDWAPAASEHLITVVEPHRQ